MKALIPYIYVLASYKLSSKTIGYVLSSYLDKYVFRTAWGFMRLPSSLPPVSVVRAQRSEGRTPRECQELAYERRPQYQSWEVGGR